MCFCSFIQRKWTEKLNHRIKSLLFSYSTTKCFITTNAQYWSKFTGISTDNILVHIPSLHTQCFALVHRWPRLWRLECCNIEQSFVYNCQRITHRLIILLSHLNQELLLWQYLVSHLNYRMEDSATINNLCPLNPIHAYRQIICRLCVRLQQRSMNIEVGSHLFRYQNAMCSFFLRRCTNPLARENMRTIFNG